MSTWLPAVSYPPLKPGYWAPITSTLNWCEEDYYATSYVAELVNTFTNLLFMALAVRGVRNCIKYGHDRIFLIGFLGYGIVGTGSFLFHATLKYPMQLVDELSMIYTTCFMCYATFTHDSKAVFQPVLALSLASLAIGITLYYHYLQDPVFHQNAYALLTALVLARSMHIMESRLRPMARASNSDDLTKIIRVMWTMVTIGLSVFLSGFAVWSLDRRFCPQLIYWRHQLGLPWGALLEGHGWWHLMTGVGAYFYIVWVIWLRYCLTGQHKRYRLRWPSVFTSMPDVVLAADVPAGDDATKNEVLNGVAASKIAAAADKAKTK